MVGKTIKKWWPIFVLPTLAAFIIGFLWPFIWGIYLSFCKFTTVQDVTFVGFSNYQKILLDNTFSHAFWLTVIFAFISSILINVLAFAIALALTKGFKGTNAFRTVFFMPNLIGGIVLGYIWQTLLNGLLSKWGQPLLALSAKNGFIGMLILLCWQQIGYMMIIYVAGLNNVSPDLIEAAQIDGATSRQILFKIKLPMIMSNHDHSRFLTRTNHRVGRISYAGPEAASEGVNPAVMREAVTIQMTWPGAPTVYYGDEAGLCGFTDPDNRRTYPWGREDYQMIDFHRVMIRIHKKYEVLKTGSLGFLWNDYQGLCYARFSHDEQIIVIVNNQEEGREVEIRLEQAGISRLEDTKLKRVVMTSAVGFTEECKEYTAAAGILKITMPAFGAVVLHHKN